MIGPVFIILFAVVILALGFLCFRCFFTLKKPLHGLFVIYLLVTVFLAEYGFVIFFWKGSQGLRDISQPGPNSVLYMTLLYVGITWLLLGSFLMLFMRNVITKKNAIVYICFYLYAFLYMNVLRECIHYGDIKDYVEAGLNLYKGEALHPRYFYPPFWGTVLQLFAPYGVPCMTLACLALNYSSLLLFFVLLIVLLKKYGFTGNFAALCCFILLVVNVPVLRTMYYGQVNVMVLDLILMTFIFYRRSVFLSAACLSLAVHLKLSPVILLLPFLFNRDWKWVIGFSITTLGLVWLTSTLNDFKYYLDFLNNTANIYEANGINFREFSFDSLIRATIRFLDLDLSYGRWPIVVLKGMFAAVSLFLVSLHSKGRCYYEGRRKEEVVYNSFVVLPFLMMMLSPIVWEHHPVFVIPSFLIMLKRIDSVEKITMLGISYFLLFLMPTFDLYPVSYIRMLGVGLCYVLFFLVLRGRKGKKGIGWFDRTNQEMTNLAFSDPRTEET